MRLIGYGGMLTESFVGIMALITAAILNQHLYFAHQRARRPDRRRPRRPPPSTSTGSGLSGAPITPEQITQAAEDVGEESIVSRTGGAPTLAIGMSEVLHQVFGGESLKAFWYHFAIMFEALFILTTVDAGTRVARFMLSDGLSNLGGPLRKLKDPSWRVGAWICSVIVVAAWGSILLMGVTDPLGGINTLFPLFGIANQLLAAIALTVVTVVVIKRGLLKWAWIPGYSAVVGSHGDDDGVVAEDLLRRSEGRVTGRSTTSTSAAKEAGKTSFQAAKNPGQLDAVIRNTFIQGTLSIVFAVLVVIVFVAGVIVALQSDPRGRGAADRGRAGAVATVRPVRTDPDHRRNGRCKSNGTRYRSRTPDRLVLGHIDGRQPLPALRRASRAHAPRRAGHVRTRVLADAPRRDGEQSRRALLLTPT